MPQETDVLNKVWDSTDPGGTYRPNEPPVDTYGTKFNPLDIPKRDPTVIQRLPNTPLDIFRRFVPESLVEKWVRYTNESIMYIRGPVQQNARTKS